jgi:hypothetical protein
VIDFRVTKFFFDRQAVMTAMSAADRRALSKAGAFIRQRARSSMRKRKRISQPGSPPSAHAGHLRKFLFFSYDPGTHSVVIGPAKMSTKAEGVSSVPNLLEFGGTVTVRKTRTIHSKGQVTVLKAGQTLTYRARPYMGPALRAEKDQLSSAWGASVKT